LFASFIERSFDVLRRISVKLSSVRRLSCVVALDAANTTAIYVIFLIHITFLAANTQKIIYHNVTTLAENPGN
jgi:hypothetical protein